MYLQEGEQRAQCERSVANRSMSGGASVACRGGSR